jgi:hypothetical protein
MSKTTTTTGRRDLSVVQENSEDELLSDLDEMINNVPSDEDPDPTMSPAPIIHSTPIAKDPERKRNATIARDIFPQHEQSPYKGTQSSQKGPPVNKTPAKTVDFQDPNVPFFF